MVVTPNDMLLDWMRKRIHSAHGHACYDPDVTRCTLLVADDGLPIVATAIDGWTENSCDVSIISDGSKRWAQRQFICGTYDYIFRVCGKDRMSMLTAVSNKPAIRMHEGLGHIQEGRHRSYFAPGQDAFSYSFLKSDWISSKWHTTPDR